jgi:PilZ domain
MESILVQPLVIRANKFIQQRRSQRIMLAIPILVSGTREDGKRFAEETHTIIVNAHGALLLLAELVRPGQLVTLRHLKAQEDRKCTVVAVGEKHDTKREVGIELLDPSPRFWHVGFAPEDWSPRGPEAKRLGTEPSVRSKSEPVR